ncbi:MAG: EamA family transporter [Chitinophagaceae bacterium]
MIRYIYILLTLLLTVYGQLILKWRLNSLGHFPTSFKAQLKFLAATIIDPFVLSSFAAAFLASLTWIAALTKFDLSYAYPFMSLSFILVLVFSYFLLNEPLTVNKLAGVLLIIAGLFIASK